MRDTSAVSPFRVPTDPPLARAAIVLVIWLGSTVQYAGLLALGALATEAWAPPPFLAGAPAARLQAMLGIGALAGVVDVARRVRRERRRRGAA